MNDLGNKEVFSRNLRNYMQLNRKDRQQVCEDLKIKYTTFTDWYNGNKYPRIDKIEMLANYFGITKADLIEEHTTVDKIMLPKSKKDLIDLIYQLSSENHIQNLRGYAQRLLEEESSNESDE